MELKKIPDDGTYFNILGNEHLHLAMHRVMFGYRVVIHPNDNINVFGSFCCGANPSSLVEVYAILNSWLESQDDVDHIRKVCRELHSHEKVRPWGRDPDFQKKVRDLIK